MKTKHLLISVALVIALTGCAGGLVPKEVNENAAIQSAEHIQTSHETELTKQSVGSTAPISVTQSGSSNVVNVAVMPPSANVTTTDTAGSTSRTNQASTTSWASSIPEGVKLILLGIGLLIVFLVLRYAWTYIRTNSPAVAAAYSAADQSLATVIGHIESKRATATDAATQANLNDLLATANKARGQLAGSSQVSATT